MNSTPTVSSAIYQASSGQTHKFPPRSTNADIKALLTGPALRHLEPRPGGKWTLESRAHETIVVKYSTRDGFELLRTTIHLAADPETAADLCWQHVYGYTPGQVNAMNPLHTFPEAQPLTPAGAGFIHIEPLDLSHVYCQPPAGSIIGTTTPPTDVPQSLHRTSAQATVMPPMLQFPPQHSQVMNQVQHAVDMSASWMPLNASMVQPSHTHPSSNSTLDPFESGNYVSQNWVLPDSEMHAENDAYYGGRGWEFSSSGN